MLGTKLTRDLINWAHPSRKSMEIIELYMIYVTFCENSNIIYT